ncbi:MAG: hypothetical protein B6D68_00365, partial [spirochete symbiont of Stewartia floridana]
FEMMRECRLKHLKKQLQEIDKEKEPGEAPYILLPALKNRHPQHLFNGRVMALPAGREIVSPQSALWSYLDVFS